MTTRLDTLDVGVSNIDTKVTGLDQRLSGRLDHIVELLEQRETAPGT